MITSISIENFKGIGERITIPLRPITLLFGKNSDGKSTILQAMHYAREILQNRNPSPDRTIIGGDTIDLGGFENLVHNHQTTESIMLEFEVDLDGDGLAPFPVASTYTEHVYGLDEDADKLSAVKRVSIGLKTELAHGQAVISLYRVGLDGEHLADIQIVGRDACVTDFNEDHPIFAAPDDADGDDDLSVRAFGAWAGLQDSSGWVQLEGMPSCMPDLNGAFPLLGGSMVIPDEVEDSSSSMYEDDANLFWIFLSRVLVRSGQALLRELTGMRYLGPIRTIPPRGHRTPLTPDDSRWSCGFGAWDAMRRSNALTERVSEYIQERLELGYSIRRENCVLLDADGPTMAELRMIAARYDEYDAAYFQANVLEPIEKLLRQPSLHLRDIINEVDVEPADIGVGVSQVIPVVVGAIASTADAGRCSIFAVEQPELHVHPRIQCNLGDVFAGEAGKSDGRVFLIETHSEHLILRLLRRIRETTENELPPGKPALTPEQVAVYFVEGGPDGMKVTEIPVAPDGDFTKQWPQGFFPERVEELM
jgi:hypothetical protein